MSNLPSFGNFAKGAAAVSTLLAGLVYYGQNYLIYPSAYPQGSRLEVLSPTEFNLPHQDLELRTEDGILLKCYLFIQEKALADKLPDALGAPDERHLTEDEFIASRPTILMFHGNGGNLGHRIPLARVFFLKMRCNVLMLSYRGYGHSEGSPSEKGIQIDSQTALNYLLEDLRFSKSQIVLYGQSIGGAVAIDLASRNPTKIAALILENTFMSLPSLVPHALPFLGPFSFLCHQKWDSASKIPLIPATTPILMLSGIQDELVPKEHMRSLWEIVAKRGEKKMQNGGREYKNGLERAKYMEFPDGEHNNTCVQPGYWQAVADFVASLQDLPEKSKSRSRPGTSSRSKSSSSAST
ncbi:hypothetical protein AX16_000774 [Volvariella volvacea WC 439]|nr:hypothetical protein AX16_000774 [Volvariella volvacea WC 439]